MLAVPAAVQLVDDDRNGVGVGELAPRPLAVVERRQGARSSRLR